ncbi:MAG: beta-lactamase family protein [Oscillochloris sp.]|nr:beta-lactamase family protein [Oscillochloris sp.]
MHSQSFKQLIDHAEAARAEFAVPGVALGVLRGGIIEMAGLGVTSLANPLPVTDDTLFQIGSITKTMLGTVVMRLVAAGRLDLDVPLTTYLPDLRLRDQEAQARASMRHLLTHTAGWLGDYFDDLGWGDDALDRIVRERMPELPQQLPLGTLFSYNNSGFYLAGRVIEQVTGMTFEAAMRAWLLQPLALHDSLFFPHDVMLRRFVVGHQRNEDGVVAPIGPWPIGRASHPAGGVVSTVGDLLRYAAFHLGDGSSPGGEHLIPAELLAAMRAPQAPINRDMDVGLTWFVRRVGPLTMIRHSGGTKGQIADLWIAPERGVALATLTNAAQGGLLTAAIWRSWLQIELGLAEPMPEPLELPDLAQSLVGRYLGALSDSEIELSDGRLSLQSIPKGGFPTPETPPGPTPPPIPIVLISESEAIVPEGPYVGQRIEIGPLVDGKVAWVRVGSRVQTRA